jgi:spore coat polysaccharide biosynthesis predicted glycosyltransferase SpsG
VSPSAVVVADAGAEAGLGHVSRSGAIALALLCRGFTVRCCALGAEEPLTQGMKWMPITASAELHGADEDVAVVDSYRATGEELAALGVGRPLVVLQDWTEPPGAAALVVSASGAASEEDERHLYGLRYACLRPTFWGLPRREPCADVGRVLVTIGAGDAGGAGAELAAAARASVPGARIRFVVGPYAEVGAPEGVEVVRGSKNLLDELLTADLALAAGGQTLLEAVACGTPTAAVEVAENQRRQIRQLEAAGAVEPVENTAGAERVLRALADDPRRRAELATRGQEAVDGYGALRVAYRIARLVAPAEHRE